MLLEWTNYTIYELSFFLKKHLKLINFACYWSPNFKKLRN